MKLHHIFIIAAVGAGLAVAWPVSASEGKIRYINEQAPSVEPITYRGQSYNDLIPDTLDIAERAELAVHGLTGPLDPAYDYELYWATKLMHNPPLMYHDSSDWCGLKFVESLALLRSVTGSDLNRQVDAAWMQVQLKSLGPDGLPYIPLEGRPWARVNVPYPIVWRADGTTTTVDDPTVTQFTHPFVIGRAVRILTIYYQQSGDPRWKAAVERMIDRSFQLLVDKGDYGYFPADCFEPNARVSPDAPQPVGLVVMDSDARLPQSLVQFYRATGYEPAKRLARKLINYVRFRAKNFDAEGRFTGRELDGVEKHFGGEHFHAHTFALLGMADYAAATGDRELAAFVEKSFAWARSQGSRTVGFFPEFLKQGYPTTETCALADMIALALKLTRGGVADHWDDADRWTRNQFAENQLTRVDWLEAATATLPRQPFTLKDIIWTGGNQTSGKAVPEGMVTEERVAERILGGFAGWPSANDWMGGPLGIMHCCTGNATRTLSYIYESMLEEKEGQLQVNLLLNRAAATADVYSHLPQEGKVVLKIKHPLQRVRVRMPEWIATGSPEVQCTIDGKPQAFAWQGRYIDLGEAKPGQYLAVVFPVTERTIKEKIGAGEYTLVLKGSTVVSIDPPGKICPLYQRERERRGELRWRPVRRFVNDRLVEY